jgi:hypothetical protein
MCLLMHPLNQSNVLSLKVTLEENHATNSVALEPTGSSPCLQEPATGLYPEPNRSNRPEIHSDTILPSMPYIAQ